MPLFSWPKWTRDTSTQAENSSLRCPGDRPQHELIRELLWHVQERECTARMLDLEHRLVHSIVDHPCFQRYPRWRTLIPTTELDQLELLCAGIPPVHAAAVLSRCFVDTIPSSQILTLACRQQHIAAWPSKWNLTAGKRAQAKEQEGRQSMLPTKPLRVNVTLSGHVNMRWRWRIALMTSREQIQ